LPDVVTPLSRNGSSALVGQASSLSRTNTLKPNCLGHPENARRREYLLGFCRVRDRLEACPTAQFRLRRTDLNRFDSRRLLRLARIVCASCCLSLFALPAVEAAAPTLDHLFPVAVQVGTTNVITAVGKFDPWPPKFWIDAPGIVFKPETNSGKFSIEIATNAPVGPHLVRVFNEQGSSGPRFLIVTREPQLPETEPNDDFKKPQAVENLPAWINGRLEKSGDVDSYAVELNTGQTLVASLEAFTLASPVDAVLRIVDGRGVQVAFNHDGSTLDPFLTYTATSAGRFVVQVFGFAYPAESDVKFTGNSKCVYRLHLSCGPYLRHALPLGVQRGVSTHLPVSGWNLRSNTRVSIDASQLPTNTTQALLPLPGHDNALLIPIGEGPELIEHEPNDLGGAANRIEIPSAVTGRIQKVGDEDRFSFQAAKDQKFLIEVQSASFGFPLDAWLKVENSKGKELAKNDDRAGRDPELEWTAPDDGTYVAAIGNVLQRGGAEYLYRLSMERATQSVRFNLTETTLAVAPGKTNEFKVTAKRLHGFKAKLTLTSKGLPEGMALEPTDVSEKGGEVVLKFAASPEAKPFSGPIQIVATEAESGIEHRAVASLTSSTENNGVPGGFTKLVIESTDQIWLTVLPPPQPKAEKSK